MSGGRHALAVGVLLLVAGAGLAVAQPAPTLRAAMLGDGEPRTESTGPTSDSFDRLRNRPFDRLRNREDGGDKQNEAFRSFAPPLLRSSPPPDTTLHDPWLGRDKALHAGGSFLLTLSGQYVLTAKLSATEGTALPIAAGTTLALGLAKEVVDGRRAVRPHFSTRDLLADAVGVALAVGLILL